MSNPVTSEHKLWGMFQDLLNIHIKGKLNGFSELFTQATDSCHPKACFSLARKLAMCFTKAFQRCPIWWHSVFSHQLSQKCYVGLDLLVQIDEWEICCSAINCILLDRK